MFRSLALAGGGMRGGIMIGALSVLEKRQGLDFPEGIYGCSAGAVIAAALAFRIPLAKIQEMFEEDINSSTILPSIGLTSITGFTTIKGLFHMNTLKETLIKIFGKVGIDLNGKVIEDAPQKLYIIASNMTKRKATLFTGKVPILEALLCSACLPYVFHPQVMYNQVFIDGGLYVHNIHAVVPSDCLVLHITRENYRLTPERVQSIDVMTYFMIMYESARADSLPPNVIVFRNDEFGTLQTLTPENKKKMFDQGVSDATAFFAKRATEEPNEPILGDGSGVLVESG
uniref:PNPLA domain-containing protein n=1 Tax=viral metagenome TaxID=1070528 RepID=A0A6C0M2Q0_9ZZZZ